VVCSTVESAVVLRSHPMTDTAQDWRAGLRVARSRLLTDTELHRLRHKRRIAAAKGSAWLLGVPLGLVIFSAAVAIAPDPHHSLVTTAMVIAVGVGLFLGLPICIVVANDHFKRAGVLKRQCADRAVLICEGAVADLVIERKDLEKLRRQAGADRDLVLEVLMRSNLVWTVNGVLAESWVTVPRGRTVGPPDQARLAAQYVRPVETEQGTFRLHQRRLSEEECVELRGYLPRIKLRIVLVAMLANAVAAAHAVAYLRQPVGVPLLGVVLVTMGVWCDAQFVRLFWARRTMRRDLREGVVVIYQPDPDADATQASVIEFLPHSRIEWTISGGAAPWRRVHGSSD
jgi:hypothetical protein